MIYIVMGKSIGSGNSTISSQILIPYVYKKTNNPEILYHLSDKSSNYNTFSKSNIIKHKLINSSNFDELDEIFKLGKENDICIDVDSSHTLKMLNFIEKNNIKNVILFISIIKNGNELKDLKSIIDLINKKVEKPQVILVFNKVQVIEDVEFDFFNIFGYKALGVPGYENLDKYEKIYIPYHSIIDISSKFNSLVYDFADEKNIESSKREEEFYTNKLNSEQDEEKQEKLLEKMDTIIAKKKLIKKAIEFIDSMNSIVNKN